MPTFQILQHDVAIVKTAIIRERTHVLELSLICGHKELGHWGR